jgi:hypothetical protein
MAQTDTRSGFRLPWSSDRVHDDPVATDGEGAPEATAPQEASPVAWPDTDFAARLGITPNAPRAADEPAGADLAIETGEPAPASPVPASPAPAPATPAPRKPSKLMVDLTAAIRATTEAARDQRLGQVETEAQDVVGVIRAQSAEGAAALRRRSDDDVESIRGWAKAEIARIKQESDTRIAERQGLLDRELEGHAIAIEDRVAEVSSIVTGYRAAMDAYFLRLAEEEDPARLATMAETMPDAPSLESFGDLDGLIVAPVPVPGAAIAAGTEATEASQPEIAPVAETAPDEGSGAIAGSLTAEAPIDHAGAEAQAMLEADTAPEPDAVAQAGDPEPAVAADAPGHTAAWPADARGDDVARWAEGETPAGFPEPTEGGDPVDRGAIMAALEAAAEAVVAAEAAAESADQAEAAADVAETAAGLLTGRTSVDDELDPEAAAALSARVDAGGFETESYTDRLASLLPGHGEGSADGEPRATQVVVTGLVSVASIASFKRHVGRLPGVTAVQVASGPDGEFVFNVTHRPDVSFRDAIPSMPGFAARVTATGDGVVNVTARDPEAEG